VNSDQIVFIRRIKRIG